METFGEKMKQAIASRGMALEDVARTTGIRVEELEALERADHDALRDEARVVDCLRRLAECIDVEAQTVIDDYLRERAGHASENRRPPKSRESLVPVVVVAAVLLGAGAWWWARSTGSSEPVRATSAVRHSAASAQQVAPDAPPPRPVVAPAAPEPAPAPVGIVIQDHGVGTGVEDRRLVGRADRFVEGTKVWFWTDVEGAARGDTIYHVWLHEGAEATIVPLSIGGPRWRTQSGKTLRAGSAGTWAVEARDEVGTVLARQEFVCTPAR